MPRIEMQHDPETGAWTYVTADACQAFTVVGYPDCDVWWSWLRRTAPAEAASVLGTVRSDVRSDFSTAVVSIQSGCQCLQCREAVAARAALRRSMMTPVKLIRDSGEPAGEVGADGRVRLFPRPLTYEQARTRYMAATGDDEAAEALEAMLATVTGSVPDLDTIGSDWEPAAPTPPAAAAAPRPRITHGGLRLVLTSTALALAALSYDAVLPREFGIAAIACAIAGLVLGFAPKART
jgi:hypothetical protein